MSDQGESPAAPRTDQSSLSSSRRSLLGTLGVAGATGVAGCSLPGSSGVAFPRLTQAWVAVDEDGSGAVILAFDGDVQSAIGALGGDREDIVRVAGDKGLDVSFEEVRIDRRSQILDDPITANERLIQARIEDFASVSSVAGRNRYATHRISYERSIDTSTQTTTSGSSVDRRCRKHVLPQGIPSQPHVPFRVLFPDGAHYVFPLAGTFARSAASASRTALSSSPFEYNGLPEERTFPSIVHYHSPQLVTLRILAQYRAAVIRAVYRLYNFEYYECQTYAQLTDAVRGIVRRLGEQGVEALVPTPVPSSVDLALDVRDVQQALTDEYSQLERALDRLSELAIASVNETWLGQLATGALDPRDERGFEYLHFAAISEAYLLNPGVAASRRATDFAARLRAYQTLLDGQRAVVERLVQHGGELRSVNVFGNGYWENLHRSAVTLLRQWSRLFDMADTLLGRVRRSLTGTG